MEREQNITRFVTAKVYNSHINTRTAGVEIKNAAVGAEKLKNLRITKIVINKNKLF